MQVLGVFGQQGFYLGGLQLADVEQQLVMALPDGGEHLDIGTLLNKTVLHGFAVLALDQARQAGVVDAVGADVVEEQRNSQAVLLKRCPEVAAHDAAQPGHHSLHAGAGFCHQLPDFSLPPLVGPHPKQHLCQGSRRIGGAGQVGGHQGLAQAVDVVVDVGQVIRGYVAEHAQVADQNFLGASQHGALRFARRRDFVKGGALAFRLVRILAVERFHVIHDDLLVVGRRRQGFCERPDRL